MSTSSLYNTWIKVGVIAVILFFIFEIGADYWLGSLLPDYDWKSQSISYIGNSDSPVLYLVKIWGVFFTLFVLLFANAFAIRFRDKKWSLTGAIMLALYGFGEGLGSAFFPIHPKGAPMNVSTLLHDTFSSLGDLGLVLLPFVLMAIFPTQENKAFYRYLWSVVLMGAFWAALFLIAKYDLVHNFIFDYKGIWQRLYLLNYYLLLLLLGLISWPKKDYKQLNES